jgi:hypothetical protein
MEEWQKRPSGLTNGFEILLLLKGLAAFNWRILKILRELIYRDVRSIQELLRSIPGGKKKGVE